MNVKQIFNRLKAAVVDNHKISEWLFDQSGKLGIMVFRWCINRLQPFVNRLIEIANLLDIDVSENRLIKTK